MNFKDIISLFKQGKATANSHLKNLLEIAAADGGLADEERRFLEYIAQRKNISLQELKDLQADSSAVPFEVPKSEREKFSQLYDLVHMMSVDKNIHSEELRLCELFAIKFGYRKEAVHELIDAIRQSIENWVGPDETLKAVSQKIKLYN
ncbi:hypothetical protein KK083_12935 [Fulvivirgaceae bacterium PWU4]|uniref:TerB family tellurite resistance protein n=1 Tax=Chryseosolibacter histidini TaxID=2782349 RepID=A0AAP2DK37_9BACT|nr:hypothetical protein [Chryseosolibacter histidini]MBT1697790.1 hypothetical protein [Chryseosolibacter histidini]